MRLFHVRLSTARINNRHQTTTVTTTSHRPREMVVSLGTQGTLVTSTKTEPVTMNSTSEMHAVNLRLIYIDKMRRICFHTRLLSLD
jgi:hypothetical protein